jgi:hypothetical protein
MSYSAEAQEKREMAARARRLLALSPWKPIESD